MYMKKSEILQRILAMVVGLAMLANIPVFSETKTDEYITVSSVENGEGITVDSISGVCDAKYNEIITYIVRDTNNISNILTIGETKNKADGTYSISIALEPDDTLKILSVEIKAKTHTDKATAVFTMNSPEVEFETALNEVERLLNECKEKGITPEYEKVKSDFIKAMNMCSNSTHSYSNKDYPPTGIDHIYIKFTYNITISKPNNQ